MFKKNGKVFGFSVAALLQTGALSAAEPVNVLEPVSNRESANATSSQTINIGGSSLGFAGPIDVRSSYNEDLGFLFGANFATYLNHANALAFELEAGENMYRLNGTWGFALTENNRFKFTLERLADKDDYDFYTGNESEWIAQNAIGAGYQYVIDKGWLQALDMELYGARAESKNLDDVVFYEDGSPFVNKRRIAGGESIGGSLGLSLLPTKKTLAEVALHYDAVNYNMKYATKDYNELDGDDPSTHGFGFSTDIEHIFTERFKVNAGTEILSTDHIYEAGLSWLAPTREGSSLELSLLGSYLDAQTTDDDGYQVGLQVTFGWDDGAADRYAAYTAAGIGDLKSWTRDPAVRMPEVMAVVDEAVFQAMPILVAEIPDISRQENSPVDFSVASYFSNADGSSLSYSATGLPPGITMDSNGTLVGTTPDVNLTQDYDINVVAVNEWGFSQSENFILTVLVTYLPPVALPIPLQHFEEGSVGQVDVSDYFEDPNLPNAQAKAKVADKAPEGMDESLEFTYALSEKPAGWDTPLLINEVTGVISAEVPRYNPDGPNTYAFEVTATNYAGSASNTITVDVIDINFIESRPIPNQAYLEGQNVAGTLDLNDYFTSENNTALSYTANGLEGSGLSVTSAGELVGTAAAVDEDTTYNATVTATNTEGATKTRPMVIVIEAYAGDIIQNAPIPAQQPIENSVLNESNSINLNDYFENEQGGAIAFRSADLSNLGDNVSIDANGFIVGTVKAVDNNTLTAVNVEAYNPDDVNTKAATATIDYTILAEPYSLPIPAQDADEESTFSLNLTDPATGDFSPKAVGDLTYSLRNAPSGWAVSPQGVISGPVPAYDDQNQNPQANQLNITVDAFNSLNNSLYTAQNLKVNVLQVSAVITTSPMPTQNITEGYRYIGETAIDLRDYFSDSEGNELTFDDNGQLSQIGLGLSNDGNFIEGTATVDANVEDLTITITATETEDSTVRASNGIIFNIAAMVSSEPLTDQTVIENDPDYEYNAALDGNFQPYNASNPTQDPDLTFTMSGVPEVPAGLEIDSITGIISGAVSYNAGGNNSYNITVTAMNDMNHSLSSSQTFEFTVGAAGDIIQNAAIPDQKPVENSTLDASNSVNLNDYFENEQGGSIAFRSEDLSNLGNNVSIDADGVIVGTVKAVDNNTATTVNVEAYNPVDMNAKTATGTIDYIILAQPFSLPIPTQDADERSTFSLNLTDPATGDFSPKAEGDLTYSLSNAPSGWAVNPQGVISGPVPAYDDQNPDPGANELNITVHAVNSLNPDLYTAQNLKINVLPVSGEITTSPMPTQNITEGYVYQGETAIDLRDYFTDSQGNELTFDDNGQLSQIGLGLSNDGNFIEGTATVDANVEKLTITITATETEDSDVTASNGIIFNIAAMVSSSNLENQTVIENNPYEYNAAVGGEFQPYNASNPEADPNLEFTMTGVPEVPAGLEIDPVTGVISGSVSYNSGGNNSYTITVTATNVMDSDLTSSQAFELTVEQAAILIAQDPGPQKAPEGTTYTAGQNAINLNDVFVNTSGNPMNFKDDGVLKGLGLQIDEQGYIVGTLVSDVNLYDDRVLITATDVNNSEISKEIWLEYTIAAKVSSVGIDDQAIEANEGLVPYSFDAADAGEFNPRQGDLVYSLEGAPEGVDIDSFTGVISGDIPYEGGTDTYDITVKASNVLNNAVGVSNDDPEFNAAQTYTLTLSPGVAYQEVTSEPFPPNPESNGGNMNGNVPLNSIGWEGQRNYTYDLAQEGNFQPMDYGDRGDSTLEFTWEGAPSYLVLDPQTGKVTQRDEYLVDPNLPPRTSYINYFITVRATQKADPSQYSEQVWVYSFNLS